MRLPTPLIAPMVAALFSLISIATSAAQDTTGMGIREWETLWTRVLTDHVDDQGRIDFTALRRAHVDLDRVVAFIATVDPVSRPQLFPNRKSRLAYYINAYNRWRCTASSMQVFQTASAVSRNSRSSTCGGSQSAASRFHSIASRMT